jgi:PAS domain S-box-containing protein
MKKKKQRSRVGKSASPLRRDRNPEANRARAIQRYIELYDFAPLPYVSFDRTGRIEEANLAAVELFGRARNRLVGSPFTLFVRKEDAALFLDHLLRCRSLQSRVETELRLHNAERKIIYGHLSSTPTMSSVYDGGLLFQTAIVDLTRRKRAEENLRETQERFRLLLEGAREYAMFLLDPRNRITFWSSGSERVFGWLAREAIGKKGDIIFTPEDRASGQVEKEIEIAKRDGRAPDRRWHQRKDGSRVWIDGVMQRLDDEETGELRGFAKIARDASAQRNAEDELRAAHADLEQRVRQRTRELQAMNESLEAEMRRRHELEREILQITERERARIGQDLHDMLCQELTATALFLKSTANQARDLEVAKAFDEAAAIVNRNVTMARELARGFQPMLTGPGGLVTALRGLCKQANAVPQLHCSLKLPRAIRVRDETVTLNLFRIAQEAVRNAVTHSGATEIVICVERERDLVRLVVEDNGKGFRQRKRGKGLGLHIMKYRANVLGGTLMVDPRPAGGSKITGEVPVKAKAARESKKERAAGERS